LDVFRDQFLKTSDNLCNYLQIVNSSGSFMKQKLILAGYDQLIRF
jgi:hypothetical protein